MMELLPKQTVTKRLKAARRKLALGEGVADEEMVKGLGVQGWLCRKVYGDEVRRLEAMQEQRRVAERAPA